MKRKIFYGLLSVLLIVLTCVGTVTGNDAEERDSLEFGNPVSYQLGQITPLENYNSEIETKHLSDAEFYELIEDLWGTDVASKAHRIDKVVDLNSKDGEVKFLNPTAEEFINWCGYWLVRDGIYGAKGEFTARHCTGQDAYDGAWIGMGGSSDDDLLQAGVDMNKMEAWVEALPGAPQYVFDVNEGDDIHVSVGKSNSHLGFYWVVILDQTTYDTWGDEFSYDPTSRGCWIVETPFKVGGQYHIGDFSTVNFTWCEWWDSNLDYHSIDYGSTGTLYKITEETLNNEIMTPGDLGDSGTSFTVDDP